MHESTNLGSYHLQKRARTASYPEADDPPHGATSASTSALAIPRPSLKSLVAITGMQIPSVQPHQGFPFTTASAPALVSEPAHRDTASVARNPGVGSYSEAGSDASSESIASDTSSDGSEADVALTTELFAAGNPTPLAAGAIVRGCSSFEEACRMLLEGTAPGETDEEASEGPHALVW